MTPKLSTAPRNWCGRHRIHQSVMRCVATPSLNMITLWVIVLILFYCTLLLRAPTNYQTYRQSRAELNVGFGNGIDTYNSDNVHRTDIINDDDSHNDNDDVSHEVDDNNLELLRTISSKDRKLPQQYLYDHTYFSFYDNGLNRVYTNKPHTRGWMGRQPTGGETIWFRQMQTTAARSLQVEGSATSQCTDIRYRFLELTGIELEVSCEDKGIPTIVSLLEPLGSTLVVSQDPAPSAIAATTLQLAMALQGREQALKVFLTNLKDGLKSRQQPLVLTVVYFEDGNSSRIAAVLAEAQATTPDLKTELIIKNEKFSRGIGLRDALEKTNATGNDVIVWLCDVDMAFTKDFIDRCRLTPIPDRQVFFPVVFSQYNPELIAQADDRKKPSLDKPFEKSDYLGYWRLFGHGNVCAYRSDLMAVGAFGTETGRSWGGEDLQLLKQFAKRGTLRIVRSLEPGLVHIYHPKNCEGTSHKLSCLMVRISNEASQKVFGKLHFRRLNDL